LGLRQLKRVAKPWDSGALERLGKFFKRLFKRRDGEEGF
jgi:hypothetical protein